MTRAFLVLAALLFLPLTAPAAGPGITVQDPWVRASAPGQVNGAGYMTIVNAGDRADTLLSVSAEAAARVELHNVVTEDGVASMRPVEGVPVPAGGQAELRPGGYHVMFLKLETPFSEGAEISATLHFEHAGEVPVVFAVRPLRYHPPGATPHAGHGGGHKH